MKIKLVLSDFHIGKGKYLENGRINLLEDFHFDQKFLEFLDYHSTGPYKNAEVELLLNGDFELGSLAHWFHDGAVSLGPGYNSTHGAQLGGMDNAGGELGQEVVLPSGAAPIRWGFWWRAEAEAEQPEDVLEVLVQYGAGQVDHLRTLRAVAPLHQWQFEELDFTSYAGQPVAITFLARTDGEVPSTFRVDDVSV